MRIVLFLIAAFAIVVVAVAGIGGWALPRLGVGEGWSRSLSGALAGGTVAWLWQRMARR